MDVRFVIAIFIDYFKMTKYFKEKQLEGKDTQKN